ncbi:acyl-CoA carboxylase subunit epsilon [Zhihengliuella sp.]|uniref:acyl-CoA carboxylase subunit epsilon n=1 Tax=Zhihengliuella sp. TaxID=1954483 RepID=UPI0028116EB8|nr:acyl-CoA carboxylase subunit epsilon [Zhihengliuella sp.]
MTGETSTAETAPVVQVVRGNPTAEELAALTAVVLSLGGSTTAASEERSTRRQTLRKRVRHTRRLLSMPGAWRSGRF